MTISHHERYFQFRFYPNRFPLETHEILKLNSTTLDKGCRSSRLKAARKLLTDPDPVKLVLDPEVYLDLTFKVSEFRSNICGLGVL